MGDEINLAITFGRENIFGEIVGVCWSVLLGKDTKILYSLDGPLI